MKIKGYVVFLSLFSISACAVSMHDLKKKEVVSPINDISLGGSFLRNAALPINGSCLKSMKQEVSSLKKSIKFTHVIDTYDMANTLNLNLKAKAGWGKFSLSAAMDYLNSIKDDNYTMSFSYQSTISGNVGLDISDYYGINALNSGGAAAYNSGEDSFIRRCGDSYIKRLTMGAVLDVNMLIRFSTQEQKQKFEASMKGKAWDIFSASAALKDEIQNSHYNATIEISAFQGGGNPTRLDGIFGADKEHHIVKCNLKNLDECSKAIDGIINYANNEFANQVKIKDGHLEAESLYPIRLSEATISSYENDFGLHINKVVPTEEIMLAREQLNTLYDESAQKALFANSVMHSAAFAYLSKNIQKVLHKELSNMNRNLSLFIEEQVMDCFFPDTQNKCESIAKKLEASLISIDYHLFDILNGAYFVNINYNWPLIFVRNESGDMDIYNTGLQIAKGPDTVTHNLKLTPASDWSYISPSGGYSNYYNGIQTRYYIGYYGVEDFVYQRVNGLGYFGVIPWNTCVNGNCSKIPTAMEIIPF